MEECCRNCRFWDEHHQSSEIHGELNAYGDCRRFPPQAKLIDLKIETPISERDLLEVVFGFPESQAYEWCGEWQPAREPEKQSENNPNSTP